MFSSNKSFRPNLLLGLYLTIVLVVFLSYLQAYPVYELPQKLAALLSVFYLFLACYSYGDFLTKIISFFLKRKLFERCTFGWILIYTMALGVGLFGSIVFITGWLLPFRLTPKLTVLNIVSAIFVLVTLYDFYRSDFRLTAISPLSSFSSGIFISLAVPGMLISFLSAFSPITYYDSLVYHLALPAVYNRAEVISSIPFNLYSFFPANIEMVFLFIMNQLTTPDYTINLFGWGLSFLISTGIFMWAKEIAGERAACIAFFLWWTIPSVLFLSVGGYIDLPLAFFVFIALRLFWEFLRSDGESSFLLLSGLVGGFATSTKYTGVICPLFLAAYLVYVGLKRREAVFLKIFLVGTSALFPFSFWSIKNYLAIGNPFFPFLHNFFGTNLGWSKATSDGYFQMLTEYGSKSHVLFDLFLAPFRIAQSSMQFGGGFDVLGDFGWAVVLFFLPLSFFYPREKKQTLFLGSYFTFSFVFWVCTKPVLRFLIPTLPVAVILASIGLTLLYERSSILKHVSILIVGSWIISGYFLFFEIADVLKPFQVPLGITTKENFLNSKLAYYSVFSFANENCKQTDKVMLVGEQRSYHLRVPFVSTNFFAPSQLAYLKSDKTNPEALVREMTGMGFTHAIFNEAEIKRMGGASGLGITNETYTALFEYLKKKCLLFSKNNVYLFILQPRPQI